MQMGIRALLSQMSPKRVRGVALALLGVAGAACIVYGCALVYGPLGWITAGAALVGEAVHGLRGDG